ncbi:MAG: cellulase [Fibrobacter sp.]|nr:cellulase [Fibrobacter sp.]
MNIRFFVSAILIAGSAVSSFSAAININQTGFYPQELKKAVAVGAASDSFFLYNSQNQKVFSGALSASKYWDASGENARIADFTTFSDTGNFKVRVQGCPDSYEFRISHDVHLSVAKASIKAFYFNRASTALESQHAGRWARSAGHPDNAVLIHPSAASGNRAANSTISSPKGWYDAGDYGKYIVNSGITTYTLLAAYEAFPDFYDTLSLNIPESGNQIPDLLDEALWNIEWMLTMQDPQDGGVYHKLTTAGFCDMIMPEEDTDDRYVVMKSSAAALDFAAVMAQSYRVFKKFETQKQGFADKCLRASLDAWSWARKYPSVFYNQKQLNTDFNPDVTTGEYGNSNVKDEFQWAATELYISTKLDSFFTIAYTSGQLNPEYSIPGWPEVATLGLYSLFLNRENLTSVVTQASINSKIQTLASEYAGRCNSNAYSLSMTSDDYYWGSNSVAANQGMAMVLGFLESGNLSLKASAINQLDYLLGRNPTGYSYVTGFGDKTPMLIHHRPSDGDNIDEPIPGFLAGGPNPGKEDLKDCDFYQSSHPALSYVDRACSYASNEIAINWNAPLVFLSGALEALQPPAVKTRSRASSVKKQGVMVSQNKGVIKIDFPEMTSGNVKVFGVDGKVLKTRSFGMSSSLQLSADWPGQVVLIRITGTNESGKKEFVEKIYAGMNGM